MDDKKIRKELQVGKTVLENGTDQSNLYQESYGKLLDSCVVYVGRFTDQGSWIRRGTKESVINSGRESPALRGGECHKSITVGSTHMFIPLKDASRVDEKTDIVPLETPLKLGSIEVVGQVCILVSIFHLMIHNGICRSILLLRHQYCPIYGEF